VSGRSTEVDAYIGKSPDFARPVLSRLREMVHEAAPEIEEDIKWGMPAFVYKGLLGHMAAFKNHVSLGFWKGQLMQDPHGLFEDRNRTRITALKLTGVSDIPDPEILAAYVREAIDLNERGLKLPVRKKTAPGKLAVPTDLAEALKSNPAAREKFNGFSYTNRKEYIEWITGAKREATRLKRLATAIDWMSEGKPRNWKYIPKK
jgi:uncharacterized protein YdeI (YjbR/CyaY-like superfamily)